jgi:hypothetical protein
MYRNTMGRILVLLLIAVGCAAGGEPTYRNGDIIFHESQSSQSKALRLAMNSPYTHMGVIFFEDGDPFVYEAVGPVKRTPLKEWIDRGTDGHFVVKRLSDADRRLTGDAIAKLREAGERYAGLPYDLRFEWSDDRIYCSELVWKMYKSALGLEIGVLQTFSDFDLSSPAVAEKIQERYPEGLPLNETVISPASMFESDELVVVVQH